MVFSRNGGGARPPRQRVPPCARRRRRATRRPAPRRRRPSTSPTGLTAAIAATVASPARTDAAPSPPLVHAPGPSSLPTLQPVPAPTLPRSTRRPRRLARRDAGLAPRMRVRVAEQQVEDDRARHQRDRAGRRRMPDARARRATRPRRRPPPARTRSRPRTRPPAARPSTSPATAGRSRATPARRRAPRRRRPTRAAPARRCSRSSPRGRSSGRRGSRRAAGVAARSPTACSQATRIADGPC